MIGPVPIWLPAAELAAEVVTPPLGGMTVDELSELSTTSPHSFIHVTAAGIDSVHGGPAAYSATAAMPATGATRLAEMLSEGVFERIEGRNYFVYEVLSGAHRAVGVVCEVALDGYTDGRVLRHERTRVATEELLVGFLDALRVHADPVALAYRRDRDIESLIEHVMVADPVRHFTSTMRLPGVPGERTCHQRVWAVPPGQADELQRLVDGLGHLYITDGHHRFAAATRSEAVRTAGVGVLTVLYADDGLTVLPFDRVVATELSEADIVAGVAAAGVAIEKLEADGEWDPDRAGIATMVCGAAAYRITFSAPVERDPVSRLDVSRLQRQVLAPVFDIGDPTQAACLRYVAGEGVRPPRLDPNEVAFLLHPTTVDEVIAVAEAGLVMPPKSTWFEPKAWGGLFLRRFED